jgi:hypothetical protein
MLVGVGWGEGVKVGVAATVLDKGLGVCDVIEPMDGVDKAGPFSPHPTRKSKINTKKTVEYLLTIPLL